MAEARERWRAMESQAAKQRTPKRRPSAGTPGSDKVKNALHKVSLQYVLGRVAASDPALGALDLTNHAQFLGLTSAQKARAIEVMATGKGLHTLKLNSLALSRSDHLLLCGAASGVLRAYEFPLDPSADPVEDALLHAAPIGRLQLSTCKKMCALRNCTWSLEGDP